MKKFLFLVLLFAMSLFAARSWHFDAAVSTPGDRTEGTTWADGVACNADTFLVITFSAGDSLFFKDGTYNFTVKLDLNTIDGTATAPIWVCGVKSGTTHTAGAIDSSDWSYYNGRPISDTANRPLLDWGTHSLRAGDHWIFFGLNLETDSASGIEPGAYNLFVACHVHNAHLASAARYCISFGSGQNGRVIGCDFTSENCSGIIGNTGVVIKYNRFHNFKDATYGIAVKPAGTGNIIDNNIFDTCVYGISSTADNGGSSCENTFNGCGAAMTFTTDAGWTVVNNIIEGSTVDGIKWTTPTFNNLILANHGDDARNNDMWDGVDVAGYFSDWKVTTGDPLFVNITADSLQVGAESPAKPALEP